MALLSHKSRLSYSRKATHVSPTTQSHKQKPLRVSERHAAVKANSFSAGNECSRPPQVSLIHLIPHLVPYLVPCIEGSEALRLLLPLHTIELPSVYCRDLSRPFCSGYYSRIVVFATIFAKSRLHEPCVSRILLPHVGHEGSPSLAISSYDLITAP